MKVILVATCLLVLLHSALCDNGYVSMERETRILQRILRFLEKRTSEPVTETISPLGGGSICNELDKDDGGISSESIVAQGFDMLEDMTKLCQDNKVSEVEDLCKVVAKVGKLASSLTEEDLKEDCQFKDDVQPTEEQLKQCLSDVVEDFNLVLDLIPETPGRIGAILLSKLIPDIYWSRKVACALLKDDGNNV